MLASSNATAAAHSSASQHRRQASSSGAVNNRQSKGAASTTTTTKQGEVLRSVLDKTTEEVCAQLIEPCFIRKDIDEALGKQRAAVKTERRMGELREKTLREFRAAVKQKMNKQIGEEKIDEKLEELAELARRAPKDANGWRPTNDDADHDTWPLRKPVYLDYIARMESIKAQLRQAIEEEQRGLDGEQAELQQMLSEAFGALGEAGGH